MNATPPRVPSTARRSRLAGFQAARLGGVTIRRAAAAMTNGSAMVQAMPAIPSGVNERRAIAVAG